MAKRIYPVAGLFGKITELTPNRIVYTDQIGQIIDLRIGNNLQVNNGQLDVVLSSSVYTQTEATNIGTGDGIFSFRDGNTLKFKSLSGNSKILFSGDTENLTINVVDVADYNHVHLISEITGLQTALDSKSNISHIHNNATQSTSGFLSYTDKNTYDDTVVKNNFLSNVENDSGSCGVVEGGDLTLTSGNGFQVSAGRGYIRDTNGLMVAISWPILTSNTTIPGDNFIYLDNTGNITCRSSKDTYDLIFLGYIATDNTNSIIYGFNSNKFPYKQFHAKLAAYIESTFGVMIESGFDISIDSSLNVLCNGGTIWADLNKFTFPPLTTFKKYFVDATNSYIPDTNTTPNMLSTQFWNDTSQVGTAALQPMPTGYYKKDCLFVSTRGNLYYQYGTATYLDYDDVLLAPPPVVNPASTNIAVIAEIIVQEGNPTFSYVTDTRPLCSRLWSGDMLRDFAASIPHHILQGLTDDDHLQYHTDVRGDIRYYTKTLLDGGQLDTRYYTETEIDSKLSLKSNISHIHNTATATTDGFMSFSDYIKLSNIQNNATQNNTDSYLLDRSHHTGTQDVSTITGLTKSSVGLSNVDNTADINKPISTATQSALDTKVDKVVGKGLSSNDYTNNDKASVDFSRTAFDDFGSSVNVSGGIISLTGGVGFSISPGVGYARNNIGSFVRISWNTLTGTCINEGDNFINVDYQGNIVITATAEQGDYIALGYIRTALSNTTVVGFSNVRVIGYNHLFNLGELFRSAIGSLVQSGCNTALQASPNDLKIVVGSGYVWTLLNRYQIADSSSFTKLFNSSDYQFVVDSSTTPDTINTDFWNNASNPAATALVPMTTNYYKKDMIALTPEGQVFYIYATSEYATLDKAKQAPVPAVPDSIKLSVIRSAAIVVQQGATTVNTLLDIRPMFNRLFDTGQAASNATVISHSNLIDLLNDDHPQYLTTGRGDSRYYRKTELDGGALDTRYYTGTMVDSLLANKSNVGHHHISSDITDLSPTTVGLGNVPNVDATNASNITSGTLSNARLTTNLSEIGNIIKNNGDLIAVVAGAYAARTLLQVKSDLSLDNVVNIDTTNASNITSGTLSNARLTSNLSQIGNITFNSGDIVYFNGTTLVNKSPTSFKADLNLTKNDVGLNNVVNIDTTNASNITSGTLSNARLSSNLAQIGNLIPSVNDYIQFNGATYVNVTPTAVKLSLNLSKSDVGLNNVVNIDTTNASNITSGTLSNTRLTSNLSQIGGISFATNDIVYYNGTSLVNISPSSYKTILSLTKTDVGLSNVANSLQVINAGGAISFASGLNASKPTAGTLGRFYTSTDQGITYFDNGSTWTAQLPSYTGDVSSSLGGTTLTLATVNSNIGTYNNVTVNGKGLVTSASNANYLLDPSNNGILVRTGLNTTGWRILSGTNNQITVTDGDGVLNNPTFSISPNPVIPGTASMTLPSGTTAQRDTPTNGQVRWNTDLGYAEISDNGVYRPLGRVAQIITGTILQTTGTTVLPYDKTVPQPTEGFQIWTASITPYYTTSTIIVIYSVFAESSSASAIVTSTLFNGTALLAALSAYTGVSNTPMSIAVQKSFVSGTTSPITLTGRIGSSVNATTYVNRGNTETFGGGLNSSYIIMELT